MLFLRMAGNRILQLANSRSEFWCLRFWLRLIFAYFCSYLHVLVFRYFVSCQTALAFCKCCCRNLCKILEKWCQNPSKFIKNPSQLDQIGVHEHCKNDPGISSTPGSQKVSAPDTFFEAFGLTWTILGTFLGPSWAPRGPKIEHFGTKSSKSREKLCPGEGLEKTSKIQ